MNDIWNRIAQLTRNGLTELQTAWMIVCGITNRSNQQLIAIVYGEIIILITCMILFFIGFMFNVWGLITLAGTIMAIVVFLTWKASSLGISMLSALGRTVGKVPLVGGSFEAPIDALKEEIQKLLYPMIVFSMGASFVAAMASIRGPGYYSFRDLAVAFGLALFITIFIYWLDAQTKLAGWVMIAVLGYSWITYYVYPIQAQGLVGLVERYTIKRSIVATENNRDDEIVTINSNTPLFRNDDGNFKPTSKVITETKAKVIGRTTDAKSKEPMYEIVLPASGTNDQYVDGHTTYVAARMVKAVVSTAKTSKIPTWQPVLERTFEGRGLKDSDWIPIAAAPTDIQVGDHLIITGQDFEFFDQGRWQRHQNRMEMTNIIGTNGSFGAKAKKGEKIMVTILKKT